ncbi:hypothetical protein C5Z25_00020 [Lactobacillus sp. CBA3605]|uniref:Gp15 family bacteriophage protein n=1 Tax=Lactobacillus sp. CBA3605 TaxID=2099788 RepID=UPI000CFD316B|nr:Gp15 family bacteriophage protein [Lactobacillus sp. CBA3605]AVK60255.1 hypothetical protein C5Z25_00020 [Lactobacillus sp. CBA3605]
MLSLTKPLDDTITVGDTEWTIDFSFDNVLKWYAMLNDDSISDSQKIYLAFDLFANEEATPDQMVAVVSEVSKYVQQTVYGNQDDEDSVDLNGDPMPQEQFFSYEKDADAIYSSFMVDYHIDLIDEQGHLRWEKFKALLDGLSDQTLFRRIVAIRQKPQTGLEGEELASLLEAQNYYRLDDEDTQSNLDSRIGQVFNMLVETAKED